MNLLPFSASIGPRCPIAVGTTAAQEAARLGANARETLLRAHRARRTALAAAAAAPPPQPAPWPQPAAPRASPPPMTAAEVAIPDLIRAREPRQPRIVEIQALVARFYGVTRNDILAPQRTKGVVKPRHVAMYLAKEITSRSLPEIGRRFDNRDHTTILHGIRKIERLCAKDEALRDEIDILKRMLGGDAILSRLELQVMLRFRQGRNTAEIAKTLDLLNIGFCGGEIEVVRLLASAREKTRAAT